jgi:hypothetical protein
MLLLLSMPGIPLVVAVGWSISRLGAQQSSVSNKASSQELSTFEDNILSRCSLSPVLKGNGAEEGNRTRRDTKIISHRKRNCMGGRMNGWGCTISCISYEAVTQ